MENWDFFIIIHRSCETFAIAEPTQLHRWKNSEIKEIKTNFKQDWTRFVLKFAPLSKPASYKSNNDFCLSNYIDLHNTSAKPGFFFLHEGEDKMIFRWNNVTLISLKHSCLIQVEGLKVRTFHIFILNVNK